MKKIAVILSCMLFFIAGSYAQRSNYSARVFDGVTYQPLDGASVYNSNTGKFAFTDKTGRFYISSKENDTLIITKSGFRQVVLPLSKKVLSYKDDIFLYYKSTMLQEVRIIAINPSYEGFKKDIVTLELPDYYKQAQDVKLSKMDIANINYAKNPSGNILSLGGTATMSPISFLYEKFNRKAKMQRLYNEMVTYENELDEVQEKYNRDVVHGLTGLEGDDLLDFMTYCHFSYYDLVRWDRENIASQVKNKFFTYQYEKLKSQEQN
ncbi:MAG: carboxypeptidase-like regulatory domain-containing protein [Bacteroidales bacterium]|nr:carboxypeptidase-like regulatory domain-containing protein [Bacteroidales bacterium]